MFNIQSFLYKEFPLLLKFRIFLKKYPIRLYRNYKLKKTNFPPEIWIENTNHCNAACVMCPRDTHTRDKGIMDFDLYSRLMKEISLHNGEVKRVHMHNFGEPLLDKRIFDRVKMAKESGVECVYFVTNASLLNKGNSKSLINSGLDELKISFYGVDKESYNSTMKNLDFDETLKNVLDFFTIRSQMKATNPKVVLQFLPKEESALELQSKWLALFKNVIDESIGDSLRISYLQNFGDGREYISTNNKTVQNVCQHPWREMVILQNGNVAPCCFDYNGTINLGSVKDSSISEIWNGHKYAEMRKDFSKLDYQKYIVCTKCDVPIN
jgi:radical SAM protein with 4Fe4S-binding SPASM domain